MLPCETALLTSLKVRAVDSCRSDLTDAMSCDIRQSTVLSSHLIPFIDARRLLGVVFSSPPSTTHYTSLNVYTTIRLDVATDRQSWPVRHQRRYSQQIPAQRGVDMAPVRDVTKTCRVCKVVATSCIRHREALHDLQTSSTMQHTWFTAGLTKMVWN